MPRLLAPRVLLALSLCAALPLCAAVSTTVPESQATPTPSAWEFPRATPESQGVSSAALEGLVRRLSAEIDSVHGLMVLRHGKLIAEGAWAPYRTDVPHTMWSLTKSFSSTAIGLAVAEGFIDLDKALIEYFPEEAPAEPSEFLKNLRVRDLLRMTTGHLAEETGRFDHAAPEPARRFLAMPIAVKPGTHWHYNNAASHMLSILLRKVTGETPEAFLTPRLFKPLGIEPRWEKTAAGDGFGAFGLHLRTRDIARFGQLLLQEGEWRGQRLLPREWLQTATRLQTSTGNYPLSDWDLGYGFQFWMNVGGGYRADGAFGQFCLVLPEHEVVIAITAGTRDNAGILRIVREQLAAEYRPAPLREDPVAQASLTSTLNELRLPGISGQATSARAAEVTGTSYRLADNPLGMHQVRVEFDASGAKITLTTRSGVLQVHHFSFGSWDQSNQLSLPAGPSPMACTGAWTEPDTYTCLAALLDQPVVLRTSLRFEGRSVRIEQLANVGFGESKPLVLEGVAEAQ